VPAHGIASQGGVRCWLCRQVGFRRSEELSAAVRMGPRVADPASHTASCACPVNRRDVSGMLTEILLLLLVLAVAVLMVVDLARTRSEHPHGQTERPTYGAERAATVLSRGPGAGAVSPEPAASVTVAPSSDASLSPRPEGIIPPPGSDHRTGTRSADDEGSRSRLMG